MKIIHPNSKSFDQIVDRNVCFHKRSVEEKVRAIVEDVSEVRAAAGAIDRDSVHP